MNENTQRNPAVRTDKNLNSEHA